MHLGSLLERTEIHIGLTVFSEVCVGKEQYGVALKNSIGKVRAPRHSIHFYLGAFLVGLCTQRKPKGKGPNRQWAHLRLITGLHKFPCSPVRENGLSLPEYCFLPISLPITVLKNDYGGIFISGS